MYGTNSSFSPLTSDQGGKEGESAVENGEVPRQDWHDRVQQGKCRAGAQRVLGAGSWQGQDESQQLQLLVGQLEQSQSKEQHD